MTEAGRGTCPGPFRVGRERMVYGARSTAWVASR
jgi:hypothetical protein